MRMAPHPTKAFAMKKLLIILIWATGLTNSFAAHAACRVKRKEITQDRSQKLRKKHYERVAHRVARDEIKYRQCHADRLIEFNEKTAALGNVIKELQAIHALWSRTGSNQENN